MKKLLLFLLIPIAAAAQTPARFDLPVLATTPGQVPVGSQPALLAVNNATVAVCGYPANMSGGMCTNTITTYTDSTLSTACPSTAQLTAPGSSACVPTTGLQGAFGFWYDAATQTHMVYTVRAKWGTFGPFDILQAGVVSGSVVPAAPAFAGQFANASVTGLQADFLGFNVNPTRHMANSNIVTSTLNPDVNVQAYGALGTDGAGPGNYTAGSPVITVPGGTNAIPGWILVLHDATTIGSASTITGCSISGGVATIVSNQNYRAGTTVYINGLSGACSALNSSTAGKVYQVLANTNTSTQFGVSTTLGDLGSSSDSGSVSQTADLLGRVATVNGTTITGSSVVGGPSMTPTITYSATAANNVGWAPDDTTFLQNAVNAACNLSNFPRGTVGLKYGRVLIPQGAYHITSTINVPNCGHIEGIGGAAGSRLISDIVPAGGTVFSFASNSSTYVANLELYADSKSFAPAKFFDVNALIDAESHWHDLTFSFSATQCTICLESGFLNLDWSNINIRNYTGDAIFAKISPVQNRSHFTIRGGTFDTGSQLSIQSGITVNSCINFDTTAGTSGFGTVLLSDIRVEDQAGTQWTDAQPKCIKFTTGGSGGIPAVVGQPAMDDMTFNLLSPTYTNKPIYLMGTDDPTSTNCPTPMLTQINQNRGLGGGWSSADGTWCGGVPIAHVPEIDHGLLDIPNWNPNPGGDADSIIYAGSQPKNRVLDSGFASPAGVIWTVDPAYTFCARCGVGGSAGYQLTGTGSPIGFPHIITSSLIPVAAGELYFFNGGVDCANVPAGATGWLLEDQSGTPLPATPNGNCVAGQNSNQGQPKYITVPGGVTGLFVVSTPGNAAIPSGLTETFSRPQLNLLSSTNALPVPYIESPYIPAVASSSLPGVAKCGAGITCAADGTISVTSSSSGRTMLCRTTTDINVTGVTAQTAFTVCSVPPNTIGANGQFFVSADFTAATGAVGCNYTVRLTASNAGLTAGPSINSGAIAGLHYTHLISGVSDRNSTASQFLAGQYSNAVNSIPGGNSATATQTMTAQQYIALTVTPSNAADTCTLNQSTIEYIP